MYERSSHRADEKRIYTVHLYQGLFLISGAKEVSGIFFRFSSLIGPGDPVVGGCDHRFRGGEFTPKVMSENAQRQSGGRGTVPPSIKFFEKIDFLQGRILDFFRDPEMSKCSIRDATFGTNRFFQHNAISASNTKSAQKY